LARNPEGIYFERENCSKLSKEEMFSKFKLGKRGEMINYLIF
jgi:hypothetical protein